MPLTEDKQEFTLDKSLIYGNVYMSGISLVFSLAMSIFILINNKLRSLSYVILCCIGISESFQSLGFLISLIPENNTRCLIAQIFIVFSDSWTMLFLSLLSYCTYSLVIKNKREIYNKKKLFILIGFIGGSIYSIIIFLIHYLVSIRKNDEKEEKMWCHNYIKIMGIVDKKEKFFGSIIPYYVINWIMMIFIIVLYMKIGAYMKQRSREDPVNSCKIMAICNNLSYYPGFGFFGWAITTIFLFPLGAKSLGPINHLKLMLTYLSGIFVCLRGFLISLFFFTSNKIWSIVKLKWKIFSKPLSNINFLQFTNQYNSRTQFDQTLI